MEAYSLFCMWIFKKILSFCVQPSAFYFIHLTYISDCLLPQSMQVCIITLSCCTVIHTYRIRCPMRAFQLFQSFIFGKRLQWTTSHVCVPLSVCASVSLARVVPGAEKGRAERHVQFYIE